MTVELVLDETGPSLTLEDAAEFLRITPARLAGHVRARRIGFVKEGRRYTFPPAALLTYRAANTTPVVAANPFGLSERSARRLGKTA